MCKSSNRLTLSCPTRTMVSSRSSRSRKRSRSTFAARARTSCSASPRGIQARCGGMTPNFVFFRPPGFHLILGQPLPLSVVDIIQTGVSHARQSQRFGNDLSRHDTAPERTDVDGRWLPSCIDSLGGQARLLTPSVTERHLGASAETHRSRVPVGLPVAGEDDLGHLTLLFQSHRR